MNKLQINNICENAVKAHSQGDIQSAQLGYKKILRANPLHFDALHLLGVCFFNDQKLEESKIYIQRALVVNPHFAEAHFNLGNTLLALGSLVEAKGAYQNAIDIKPNYINAYNNLGSVLRASSESEQASSIYEKALQIEPSAQLWYNYGNVLGDLKLLDEAEAAFLNATNLDPQHFTTWDALGSLYANQGRYLEALPFYQQAIVLQPNFAESHSNISGAYIEVGQFEKGLLHARKAVLLNQTAVPALSNLGAALINTGLFDEAKVYLAKAFLRDQNFLKCSTALGRLSSLQGNWQVAIEHYCNSYVLDPENQGLEDGVYIAILFYLLGDIKEATRYLELTKLAQESDLTIHQGAKAYWLFLNGLFQHQKDKSESIDVERLYVIGESHTLPYADMEVLYDKKLMQCQSLWVTGCKQWHLGNNQCNQYKAAVKHHFELIPTNSVVLLTIGEIDCRSNEGIAVYLAKHPENSSDVIWETIENYLNWIVAANESKQHAIIISGVPAPNIDFSSLEIISKDNFVALIAHFNQVLQRESLQRGFQFLDVYSMTHNGNGVSNIQWHLDEFHLTPAAGQEAFAKHLIK